MDYQKLGSNIRNYRRLRNITQEQLAEASSISSVFLSQIENAKGKPSLETIVNIAYELNISLDILVYGKVQRKFNSYIDLELTQEQTNIIASAFKRYTQKEVSAILTAFTYLLDIE